MNSSMSLQVDPSLIRSEDLKSRNLNWTYLCATFSQLMQLRTDTGLEFLSMEHCKSVKQSCHPLIASIPYVLLFAFLN